ncbi:hypothetical protein BT63DRAFT_459946 [Microthyrium microscopicum]|uniref:Rhodopsin domain-containing protein n=1 Tax=Microthyrium microscopicum TaxID=703497 RepID=A0A6A6U020_9PEZI|nr:hypothetical protein BT63DRAFT_459946 [Microthyrium microscopicum]
MANNSHDFTISKRQDALTSHAILLIATISPLFAVSTILAVVQLSRRLRSLIIHGISGLWDDFFLLFAALFSAVAFVSTIVAINDGFGEDAADITREQFVVIHTWIAVAHSLWLWASVFVKMSLGITIIRIKLSTATRAIMSTFVAILPISVLALWIPSIVMGGLANLQPHLETQNGLLVGIAVIFLSSNIILTIPPLLFLFSRRPLRETLIAIFLVTSGLLASLAALGRLIIHLRLATGTRFTHPPGAVLAILASIDTSLTIIAACCPTIYRLLNIATSLLPTAITKRIRRMHSNRAVTTAQHRYPIISATSGTAHSTVTNLHSIHGTIKAPNAIEIEPSFLDRWSRDLGLDGLPESYVARLTTRNSGMWNSGKRNSGMWNSGKRNSRMSWMTWRTRSPRMGSLSGHQSSGHGSWAGRSRQNTITGEQMAGPMSFFFPRPPKSSSGVLPVPVEDKRPRSRGSGTSTGSQTIDGSTAADLRRMSGMTTWLKWEKKKESEVEGEGDGIGASELTGESDWSEEYPRRSRRGLTVRNL